MQGEHERQGGFCSPPPPRHSIIFPIMLIEHYQFDDCIVITIIIMHAYNSQWRIQDFWIGGASLDGGGGGRQVR